MVFYQSAALVTERLMALLAKTLFHHFFELTLMTILPLTFSYALPILA